jgi:3-carboxy-cis,cis-muconate cycloisomerase
MAQNLDTTRGLILAEAVAIALAKQIGRMPAHHLIEQVSRRALESSRTLRDVLVQDKQVRDHLSTAEIDKLLDPKNYMGSAASMIDRVLADHKKLR